MLVTDREGRIVVVLAGCPKEQEEWAECLQGVSAAMEQAFGDLHWTQAGTLPDNGKGKSNRRGPYYTLAAGFSFGSGQKVSSGEIEITLYSHWRRQQPGTLGHSKHNQRVIATLLSNPCVRRLAGYGSGMSVCDVSSVVH